MMINIMSKTQKKARKTKYQFDQYWAMHYTEIFPNTKERDYKVIIKARSSEFAKSILKKKVKEDNSKSKITNLQIYMLKPKSALNNLRLTIEDWKHVHQASFPNVSNILFKYLMPRPAGWKTRTNSKKPINPCLFKKGNQNRKNNLTFEQKAYLKWDGVWKPWPTSERNALKEKIILALKMHGNNRSHASKYLKINQRHLYKLMKEKFIEVDWAKEFPPPEMSIQNQNVDHSKRIAGIQRAWDERSAKLQALHGPKILELHERGYSVTKICKELGHNKNFIRKVVENSK